MISLLFRWDPRSTCAEPHERGDQNTPLLFSVPNLEVLYGGRQNCLYLTEGKLRHAKAAGFVCDSAGNGSQVWITENRLGEFSESSPAGCVA